LYLFYAVSQKAEDGGVYHNATELREENPEVVEAETLKSILSATVESKAN
jgi:hypothetical protein